MTIEITNLWEQLCSIAIDTRAHCHTGFNLGKSSTFYINMHSDLLPLLGISTPKNFLSIMQFSSIHINLGCTD